MSTFNGVLREVPSISIDRFDKYNLKNKVFFLSHCHMDHMVGLENKSGLPGTLYLSEISAVFVKFQYPNIKNLVCLEINTPTKIEIDDGDVRGNVYVTAIPAGHCPGSVMFLFETGPSRILYTGDFRIPLKQLENIEPLVPFNQNKSILHSVYLDTTFFKREYDEFPTQFESITAIYELIKEWIVKGPKYLIHLKLSARYGAEYVYIELARILKMKVHVNAEEYLKYKYIPQMDNSITDYPQSTQIHACYNSKICPQLENTKFVRLIKPSAMIWKQWKRNKTLNNISRLENNIYRVCYSNHSSYSEIKDFLMYLKAQKVYFNVKPEENEARLEMDRLLNEIMESLHPKAAGELQENSNIRFRNIKTHKIINEKTDDSSDEDFKLSVPCLKRQKPNF